MIIVKQKKIKNILNILNKQSALFSEFDEQFEQTTRELEEAAKILAQANPNISILKLKRDAVQQKIAALKGIQARLSQTRPHLPELAKQLSVLKAHYNSNERPTKPLDAKLWDALEHSFVNLSAEIDPTEAVSLNINFVRRDYDILCNKINESMNKANGQFKNVVCHGQFNNASATNKQTVKASQLGM